MPGIVGIVGPAPGLDRAATIDAMLRRMNHAPGTVTGKVDCVALDLCAGWVCHPHSFADCQPIWNVQRDIGLVFSGEHFADAAECDALRAAGFPCREGGDTASYLVHLYEQHGHDFFAQLNGCFSGLLIDQRKGRAVLFIDRYGMQRVYVHEDGDALYFASEAKALLAVLPATRSLDEQSLGEFLSCGVPLQNRSLYRGISLLPGGSQWIYRSSAGWDKQRYFTPGTWEEQPPLASDEYDAAVRDTLRRVVPRYLGGRQPVALSLTGGVDSRLVLAMSGRSAGALPCYTFGGLYRECADVRIARRVAASCGQPHQVLSLDDSFFPAFSDLAARSVFATDGALDVTGAVGLFVNRAAREVAPVRLTGNYGGEILRRLILFRPQQYMEPFLSQNAIPSLDQAEETYCEERKGRRASFVAFKQMAWHHFARFSMEQSLLTIRSPYLDNELVALTFRAPDQELAGKELSLRMLADVAPALQRIPTDRGRVPEGARPPRFWQRWLQEFVPRAEYVYDYGMPPWLVRIDRLLAPLHIERLFLGRQKYYHFRVWYRRELAGQMKAILLDPRTLARPYLNARQVERMALDHARGVANHTLAIHKLLTLEFIERMLLVPPATASSC